MSHCSQTFQKSDALDYDLQPKLSCQLGHLFYFIFLAEKSQLGIWFCFLFTLSDKRVQLSLIVKILKILILFGFFLWLFHFKGGKSTLACHPCMGLVVFALVLSMFTLYSIIFIYIIDIQSGKYYKFLQKVYAIYHFLCLQCKFT